MNKNTGKLVKNIRSNKIGVVLREFETGQVQVLESIQPYIINTHDSWETLEILEDNTEEIEEYKRETFEQLGYEVGKMSIAIVKGLEKAVKEMGEDLNK